MKVIYTNKISFIQFKRQPNYIFKYFDDIDRLIHIYNKNNSNLFGIRLRKYYI